MLSSQKSPFEILLSRDVAVDHYSLTVSYDTTTLYPYREFEILSHSSHKDSLGWLHVVGEIKNIGTQDATFVEVVCAFYDSQGTVIYAGFTFSDPYDLSVGQTAPFEILLLDKALSNKVDHYSLQFQCNEYTTPPDETPPSISNIKNEPENPKPDEQVTVTATITDASSGVDYATLYYRTDGSWTSWSMSRSGDIWSATIPAQEDGVTVNYYIKAADKAGNLGQSNTYSYTVREAAEGGPAIPGFPLEAIIIGILLATGVLIILRKPRGASDSAQIMRV